MSGGQFGVIEQLLQQLVRAVLCAHALDQHRLSITRLDPGVIADQRFVFLGCLFQVAFTLERSRVQQVAFYGTEVRIRGDQFIQCLSRAARIASGELRARQTEHHVRVVSIEPGQRGAICGDGLVILTGIEKLLSKLALRVDAVGEPRSFLRFAQIPCGIDGLAHGGRRASRSTSPEHLRENLHQHIGEWPCHGEQGKHPDP